MLFFFLFVQKPFRMSSVNTKQWFGSFHSSKALSSYRQIRRKYREQVWRLEQKLAAMMESQHSQSGATKAAEEALEWRREETVL